MLRRLAQKMLLRAGLQVSRTRDPIAIQQRLLAPRRTVTIFDVGAHRGETAQRYAEAFPDATIHSFEPFPDSFSALDAVARASDRIVAHRLAVTDRSGEQVLNVNGMNATHSLLPRPRAERRYYPVGAGPLSTLSVAATSLDDFCARRDIPRVDILKMDIQGGELKALRGATKLLDSVDLVFTEVMFVAHYEGAPLFHELSLFLASRGFGLYDLFLASHGANGQLRYGDAIFISTSVRESVVNASPAEP